MKIYISEDRTRGRFAVVSLTPRANPYATVETAHPSEVMQNFRDMDDGDTFEEDGALFIQILPKTALDLTRDFLARKFVEPLSVEMARR